MADREDPHSYTHESPDSDDDSHDSIDDNDGAESINEFEAHLSYLAERLGTHPSLDSSIAPSRPESRRRRASSSASTLEMHDAYLRPQSAAGLLPKAARHRSQQQQQQRSIPHHHHPSIPITLSEDMASLRHVLIALQQNPSQIGSFERFTHGSGRPLSSSGGQHSFDTDSYQRSHLQQRELHSMMERFHRLLNTTGGDHSQISAAPSAVVADSSMVTLPMIQPMSMSSRSMTQRIAQKHTAKRGTRSDRNFSIV